MNIKKKYTIILSILLSIYSIVATSIPFLTSLLVDEAIALYDKKENTCYSNNNGYCSIDWCKEEDYKVYEFEDVIIEEK